MKRVYHGFGGKLHHDVPSWARDDALFHIRIRVAPEQAEQLTTPELASALLRSVQFYETKGRWWVNLFLLMPDHLHALLAFGPEESMSEAVRDWKRFHARTNGVKWQGGFFDHRLRDHDVQASSKRAYILRNPVAAGLCSENEDWPWKYESAGAIETRGDERHR